MSHREHAPGVAERGNDWLDGALAGWLLFIAISAGPYLWALTDGVRLPALLWAAAPVLAVVSIFPLLRFHRAGWFLALAALLLMGAHEAAALAAASSRWRPALAFLVVHALGIAYLLWIIPEFWPRHAADDDAPMSPVPSTEDGADSDDADRAAAAVPAGPTPVEEALAAIHRRIVAAGSACAVTTVSARAEAGRFGVTPAALRTEGLALYGTFLRHFLADGALSPDEERELICLERALDLDDDGVWRMRREAGLHGAGSPAPRELAPTAAVDTLPTASAAGLADAIAPPSVDPVDPVDRSKDVYPADAEEVAHTANSADSEDADGMIAEDSILPVPADADRPAATMDDDAATVPPPAPAGVSEPAADPDGLLEPSAKADIASPLPRIHSPGEADAAPALSVNADADVDPDPVVPAEADDAPLHDYEEHELAQLIAWAGIGRLPADARPRAALERLRALHRVSTEPLEIVQTNQPLEPGERALAVRDVELYRAASAAPGGALFDIPGPVLDPRALVAGGGGRDLSGLQRTGACRFVLTERRLLLVAPSGQQSPLSLGRVRAVVPYGNGVEVRPLRGSPVFLAFRDGVDDVAMRIDRAARDLRASA